MPVTPVGIATSPVGPMVGHGVSCFTVSQSPEASIVKRKSVVGHSARIRDSSTMFPRLLACDIPARTDVGCLAYTVPRHLVDSDSRDPWSVRPDTETRASDPFAAVSHGAPELRSCDHGAPKTIELRHRPPVPPDPPSDEGILACHVTRPMIGSDDTDGPPLGSDRRCSSVCELGRPPGPPAIRGAGPGRSGDSALGPLESHLERGIERGKHALECLVICLLSIGCADMASEALEAISRSTSISSVRSSR